MKKDNLWRIIWVVGIYAALLVILYLVILYKVEWEHKDLNTYLYIYDCENNLCTSSVLQKDYYSKVVCEDDVCPYIDSILNDNLILKRENKSWIYNYVTGEVINDDYNSYKYIGNNNFIVSDSDNSYGVIDLAGNILIDLKYDYIDDYKNGYISYIEDNLYGIINIDNDYYLKPTYEDVVLINDKLFAGMMDNIYQLHSYDDINNSNSNKYDYVYSSNGILFVISNKKVDLLDSNLNSTLLMKIDCFYEYKTGQERDSLKIYSDENNIYFRIFTSATEYKEYVYNIKNKKLV